MNGILLLTKSVFAIMIGFLFATVLGLFIVPLLRRKHLSQNISNYVGNMHEKKSGTPTFGGLIFIIPTVITMIILILTN